MKKPRLLKTIKLILTLVLVCAVLSSCVFLDLSEIFSPVSDAPEFSRTDAEKEIPYYDLRYFMSSLDGGTFETVYTVYSAISDFKEEVRFSKEIEKGKLLDALHVIELECEELFQIDFYSAFTYEFGVVSGRVNRLYIKYRMGAEEYSEKRSVCEKRIADIVSGAEGLSDDPYEKEKYIFDKIALECEYHEAGSLVDSAYGALVSGKAKCDGISRAFKWVCEAAGFQCVYVTAEVKGGDAGHAWNMIRLDGENYYNVDLTQSVRSDDPALKAFNNKVIYYCFNMPDEKMTAYYTVEDFIKELRPLPVCGTYEKSYYAQTGDLIYKNTDPFDRLFPRLDEILDSGGDVILQFVDEGEADAFSSALFERLGEWMADKSGVSEIKYVAFNYGVCVVTVCV